MALVVRSDVAIDLGVHMALIASARLVSGGGLVRRHPLRVRRDHRSVAARGFAVLHRCLLVIASVMMSHSVVMLVMMGLRTRRRPHRDRYCRDE
ncbi:MAG: hypothetical protein AAGF32_00155 [Pseudomonadota bacterium]